MEITNFFEYLDRYETAVGSGAGIRLALVYNMYICCIHSDIYSILCAIRCV